MRGVVLFEVQIYLGIIILYNYILLYIDCNIIQSELLQYYKKQKIYKLY